MSYSVYNYQNYGYFNVYQETFDTDAGFLPFWGDGEVLNSQEE